MRILNKTHWDTRTLMRLVSRVAQDEMSEASQRRGYRVYAEYKRKANGGCLGRAAYGSSDLRCAKWMKLYLPREGPVDTVTLAHTIAHEFAHSRGLRHRDMHTQRYGYIEGWREFYAWASEFSISAKTIRERPTSSALLERKLTHAEAMKSKAGTRARRAKTILIRWERRVRYYEKKLAALQFSPTNRAVADNVSLKANAIRQGQTRGQKALGG